MGNKRGTAAELCCVVEVCRYYRGVSSVATTAAPTQSQCNDDMSKLIIKRVKSLAATLCLLLLLHRILQPEVNTVKV